MENKLCSKCNTTKSTTEFGRRHGTREGQIMHWCKLCIREKQKRNYRDNRVYYLAKAKEHDYKTDKENKNKLLAYLLAHPCVDCGEDDIIVLDLDHRDMKTKEHRIAEMLGHGYSWNTISKEIAKCDVRCANCHRRRTAKQLNHWRGKIGG